MNPWIDVAGWTLVHFLWQGALLAFAAAAILRLLRSASAQTRYLTACGALAAMLLAPIVTARLLVASPGPMRVVMLQRSVPAPAAAPQATVTEAASAASTPIAASGEQARTFPLRPDAWLPALVALWLAGVAFFVIRLAGGWWRVRTLHRTALDKVASHWGEACQRLAGRLGLRRSVHVVDSRDVDTPTVVGWLRPVVLLPIAALANLTPAQVEAILSHELAHIRRHDFAVNVLQTIGETLLFYHPAVWWVSERIRVEREHCCDVVAVELCGDAVTYAEALTELEAWRTGEPTLALAATDGSLLDRVRRVLGVRVDDRSWSFSAATTAAVVVLLLVISSATYYVRAAQPDVDRRPAADTTSLHGGPTVAWRMVFDHPSGQLNMIGFTARELIRFAWQLPNARIIGGPGWLDTETFRVVTNLSVPPGADEMQSIVRQVLEDEFKLAAHLETRDFPAYALVMARSDGALGPNLRPSARDCFDLQEWIAAGAPPRNLLVNAQRQPVCGEEAWDSSIARTSYVAITMPQLAAEMRGFARVSPRGSEDREVVDRTGLPGRFDVDLHALIPAAALMSHYPVFKVLFEPLGIPSMPKALEDQLGLKLEDTTAPYDVVVIDSAERPTTN